VEGGVWGDVAVCMREADCRSLSAHGMTRAGAAAQKNAVVIWLSI
jgi:hypothetical protein